ncbi:MAG: DNA mismatch repair endonuclease MutL [Candidatus Babeliales bacterium]
MNIIKQLSPEQANQIAAGQVVERPANIVKELIENSIDAGATRIELFIEQGGHQLIRVIDNGHGMSPDDAHACFLRHATSKLANIDELPTLTTFGFRGEALASIAAVSNVTLITKHSRDDLATKIALFDGKITACNITATTGTDITVEQLFYNVPARKKFLKKDSTEWRAIEQLFEAFCLSFLTKHFILWHDGKQILNCPPVATLTERVAQLLPAAISTTTIPLIDHEQKGIAVSGAITHHHYFRYDRNNIFLFVNNRWVKNKELSSAMLNGYLNVLPAGRFPAGCISITVDPHEVDINTHPRKEEVVFVHPRRVSTLITTAVKATLEAHLSKQLARTITFAPSRSTTLPPDDPFARQDSSFIMPPKPPSPLGPLRPILSSLQTASNALYTPNTNFHHNQEIPHTQTKTTQDKHFTIIGQLSSTYILLDHEDGLFVVDQHAAHERVLYEQFKSRFGNVPTIELMFPHVIELTQHDIEIIADHLELLVAHGVSIERFGPTQLRITSTPVHAKEVSVEELLKEMIGWIKEADTVTKEQLHEQINEKLHAQMACKAAIKAGDILNNEKMHALLTELYACENRFICAHGRPTGWLLSTHEIEKKFKRVS